MINSVLSIPCDECNSTGLIFFGNDYDYDVETCDCIADVADELTVDWVNE